MSVAGGGPGETTDRTTEAAAVTSFWRGLDLPGIIDVHTHFMPEPVMRKVWQYFDAGGPLIGGPWPISYREDAATRLELLGAFGVRAFTSLVYPHKPGMAEWLNAWSAEFATDTPGCLHTATFFPEPGALWYTTAAIEAGARVFKAHIQVGNYNPADPALDDVWGLLEDSGVPTVIHCGSGPIAGRFTGPEPIRALLHRHPHLPLIIAHLGSPEFAEFLALADEFPSILLDTTMVFTDFGERMASFPPAELDHLADLGDRVLFGSDFPNIPYRYLDALTALPRAELGDEWLRRVCYRNGAELFGLEPHN
jgi:hypothetical protein